MATAAPYSRKLNLTRDQLAQFLTDQQQIRQFELLFSVADAAQYIPDEVNEAKLEAGSAQATANDALAQLTRLAQSLELLALAPVRNNIELAHDVNGILPYANQTASVRSNQVLTWLTM